MTEAVWLPTLYTPSLTGTEDFVTDGDKLIKIVEKYVRLPGQEEPIVLDEYQKWLLRHWLERYPDDHPKWPGELRLLECITSLARQNGKSVLGLCMAIYYLLFRDGSVVGLASQVEQANIIYAMAMYAINNSPELKKRFKATGTRGIKARSNQKNASYSVRAGNGDSLQGVTADCTMFDELHISKMEAYDAMLDGISARKNAMILGITTAGDEDSHLLKRLYETGKKAVAQEEGYNERFGFFLWEAPEHLDIYSPEAILAANPSLASGSKRIDLDNEIMKMRSKPEHHSRRYRLNQFVAAENPWMSPSYWQACIGETEIDLDGRIILTVDRSPNWEYASIVATQKQDDEKNRIVVEVWETFVNPNVDQLKKRLMDYYNTFDVEMIFMDVNVLKDLHRDLKDENIPVEYVTATQLANATATAYSLITLGRVVHGDHAYIRQQLARVVTENAGDGYKVSRKKSNGAIDTALAAVIAIWAAENTTAYAPTVLVV